ncbi:hypothetical protein BT69DRAFT_1333093 [Atractiella rhizophila]|nr:hypothetical protein BT69DRAFT_1333093 [Atractiella rhizophila]
MVWRHKANTHIRLSHTYPTHAKVKHNLNVFFPTSTLRQTGQLFGVGIDLDEIKMAEKRNGFTIKLRAEEDGHCHLMWVFKKSRSDEILAKVFQQTKEFDQEVKSLSLSARRGFEAKCHREPLKHKDALRELKLKKENQKWKEQNQRLMEENQTLEGENQKWKEQNQRLMEENKELRGTLLQLVRDKALLLGDAAVRDSPSVPNSFIASSQSVSNSSSYFPKHWPKNVDSIVNRTEHEQREESFSVVRPSASSNLTGHNGIFLQTAGNAKDCDREFRNLQEQLKELQGKFATLESNKADISGAPRFEEVERSVRKEEQDNRGPVANGKMREDNREDRCAEKGNKGENV